MWLYNATGGQFLPRDTAQFLPEAMKVSLFGLDGELYALRGDDAGVLRYLEGQTPMWEELGAGTVVKQEYTRNYLYRMDYHELMI